MPGVIISVDEAEFLNLRLLPALLTVKQTGVIMQRHEDQIQTLVRCGLLKPVGKPVKNSVKLFITKRILELKEDVDWQEKAARCVARAHSDKSERRRKKSGEEGAAPGQI